MVDAQKLLDQFLGTGRGVARPGSQAGFGQGAGSGDPLQQGLGKLLGGALGGTGARSGGGIGDLIGGVLSGSRGGGGGLGGGLAGQAIGGALAGGLASQLLRGKRGKGLGGSALKLGGLALVAGLGYKAWQNYQAQQGAGAGQPAGQPAIGGASVSRIPAGEIPPAEGTRFHPTGDGAAEGRARLLLSAMIAAAKADGYIDRDEEEAIFGRIEDLKLDAEEKGVLMDELRRPLSIDQIVERSADRETAIEVYTASVLAIDADHPAERAYLDLLAARLNLPPELVAEIRRAADEAQA